MPENVSHTLVVSPHFDDAVFSCGAFIAARPGSVVHTVFSGCPAGDVTTDRDQHSGFGNAAEAMHERACEDDFALKILGAVAERGDFLDAQYVAYGTAPTAESIASKLGEAVRLHGVRALLVPLGLFHSDHELGHRACINVWNANPALKCFAYEDALYRRMSGLLQTRVADLAARGISATPEPAHWRANQHDQALKREAVKRTQVSSRRSDRRATTMSFVPNAAGSSN